MKDAARQVWRYLEKPVDGRWLLGVLALLVLSLVGMTWAGWI